MGKIRDEGGWTIGSVRRMRQPPVAQPGPCREEPSHTQLGDCSPVGLSSGTQYGPDACNVLPNMYPPRTFRCHQLVADQGKKAPPSHESRVRETFELNQLKSAPSQLLPVFSGFDRLQTCCHSFGPANILYFFSSAG